MVIKTTDEARRIGSTAKRRETHKICAYCARGFYGTSNPRGVYCSGACRAKAAHKKATAAVGSDE